MSRIETSFGSSSTAAEVAAGIDLSGRRAIVTGGASGIGVETARALAGIGAEVTIAVRDIYAGARVAADITTSTGNADVHVVRLDLADLGSVRAFTDNWTGPLDILVNNAGVMRLPNRQLSPEGGEMQFATNHIGHFALAHGLHGALAEAGEARIVSVSSLGHLSSPVVFDDLNFAFRPYDPAAAYGQAKTANVLFAVGATQQWRADGITANAVMPGAIRTNLQRHADEAARKAWAEWDIDWKTPQQGAATSVLLASSPLLKGIGGRYFEDCNEAVVVTERGNRMSGVAPYALDPANAERLWTESLRLISGTFPTT